MSDAAFNVLTACLVALLYLFLLRVVLLVARELRGTPAVAQQVIIAEPVSAPPPPEPARRRSRAWNLVIVEPPARRGESFPVDAEATIGRGGGCGIALPDDTFVSTVHARAFTREGELWVEDLGSTNGTLVGGAALTEPLKLRKGDTVQIGGTLLEVRR